MDIIRKYADIIEINERCQKTDIPELPKNTEELNNLLEQDFRVLRESKPASDYPGGYRPGTEAITELELQCPFCEMKFRGVKRDGCFIHYIFPFGCPNCNFPNNIISALRNLRENKIECGEGCDWWWTCVITLPSRCLKEG